MKFSIVLIVMASRAFSLAAGIISAVALAGYTFNQIQWFTWGQQQQMALPTATAILLNCVAVNIISVALLRINKGGK